MLSQVSSSAGTSLCHLNPIYGCLSLILSVQLELMSKVCWHIRAQPCNAVNSEDIFEEVFDDGEDIFEKDFDDGEDIFERVFDDI